MKKYCNVARDLDLFILLETVQLDACESSNYSNISAPQSLF